MGSKAFAYWREPTPSWVPDRAFMFHCISLEQLHDSVALEGVPKELRERIALLHSAQPDFNGTFGPSGYAYLPNESTSGFGAHQTLAEAIKGIVPEVRGGFAGMLTI